MNKKLKRYLDEGERVESKIAELQEQLKGIHAAQKMEEDLEIVKSIRSMKLNGRDLFSLLCGLQEGSVVLKRDGTFVSPEEKQDTEKKEQENAAVSERMPEREGKEHEKKMEED